MNQHVFKFMTWGVVCAAVLSSVWLASNVSTMDLPTLEASRQGDALIALPTEPTAAGVPSTPASGSAATSAH